MTHYYKRYNLFFAIGAAILLINLLLALIFKIWLVYLIPFSSIFFLLSFIYLNKIYVLLLKTSDLTFKEVLVSNLEKILLIAALNLILYNDMAYLLFIMSIILKYFFKISTLDHTLKETCLEFDELALKFMEEEDDTSNTK